MSRAKIGRSSDEYLSEALDDVEAATRFESEGNIYEAKQWLLAGVLDLLRSATRRGDGLQRLREGPAATYLRRAAGLDAEAHPVYLLDAAHVALLLNVPSIARDWLASVGALPSWSSFWSTYAQFLLAVIDRQAIAGSVPDVDMAGQDLWLPYFHFMRAASQGISLHTLDADVRRCFEARQTQSNDPGLLDGRPWDPIAWDWRREAILAAARRNADH